MYLLKTCSNCVNVYVLKRRGSIAPYPVMADTVPDYVYLLAQRTYKWVNN